MYVRAGGIRVVVSAVGDLRGITSLRICGGIDALSPLVVAVACPLSMGVSFRSGCFAVRIDFDRGK